MKRVVLFLLWCSMINVFAQSQLPPFLQHPNNTWADSVLNSMSLDEKIGQLFMIAAYSNRDETHYSTIEKYIKDYKIGGLIFFQGTMEKQAELTNRYQAATKLPLWIGFDGEWGLNMRLENTIAYPRQLTLGAVENDNLLYDMGVAFARQMKRIGININFAPDVDVNINPNNPVINDRSFGDNKFNVVRKAYHYMKGMQDNGLMACAKHFPGHGDTDVDSHKDMPVLTQSRERLNAIELYPFNQLIRYGVSSVMVAHMNVLAIDNTPNLPSTLSPKVIQKTLKDEMQFKGLVFTDALNMKGVAKNYPSGVAEVKAILAGCDVLLFPDSVDLAVKGIRKAVADKVISEEQLNERVRKILLAKYWMGLNNYQPINLENLRNEVQTESDFYLKYKLLASAITVPKDSLSQIPIITLQRKIAHVAVGYGKPNRFGEYLDNYTQIDHFYISRDDTATKFNALLQKLKSYNIVIADVQNMSRYASKNYGTTENELHFLSQLNKQNRTILTVFGSPYSLKYFQKFPTIVLGYTEEPEAQEIAAQIIFGARGAHGILPVSVGALAFGEGICTIDGMRLKYGPTLDLNIPTVAFNQIDKIAQTAIDNGVMPGCQILVAKDGEVIYEKAFGYHTYDNDIKTTTNDLYDLASVTKITSTLPLIMKLHEKGKLNVNYRLADYYTYDSTCNKGNLIIKEILCHQAGLPAWIPFYKNTIDSLGNPMPEWYARQKDDSFSIKITDNLFLKKTFADTIWKKIYSCDLQSKEYRYSDLGYYLMKQIVEKIQHDSLENMARKAFYAPLGMNYTLFNPKWKGYDLSKINPTENEKIFRQTLLLGTVHDQGAALLGGVGGHAGLFSNANDLAKYFQMLLNKGYYGGFQYFDPGTVNYFTSKQYAGNRRGIGFDKPAPKGQDGPTCDSASPESFGHTGFTGTMVWADPKYDLIYIFLSNRVYPTADNKKLINQGTRTKIQQVIYDAIGAGK
ncbi:MAG TPA: glycoside hydrolase family 3 N-terminal domain-containing protein [Chitinophagales bacterium]|nr:glycoside hydrolase family 3 N-terminal domain-containing protein [Chitinophagales bacterium]HNL83741.1 glycoside hydrolase family 3 N-terminal domain-containing protein [Chitinophagales bacterium]